ncbi:MAG: hypothetical protein ACLQB4_13590, partial [Beijerinckiaceae bacterium]
MAYHARKTQARTTRARRAPIPVFGTVPRKPRNRDRRPREYLTRAEVDLLGRTAQGRGRYGHRDATMILIAYRRPAEVVSLFETVAVAAESRQAATVDWGKF